jgi:FMN phosphatase YigB (HAD superfamily)
VEFAESRDRLRLLPENMRVLILTHDVDWPRNGPGVSHILARHQRFGADVMRRVVDEGFNLYYGMPAVTEVEERFHVSSTFSFRPRYDDGNSVVDYEDAMRELARSGWEIGLHVNDPSTVEQIVSEKKSVEKVAGLPVYGSRIHYLELSETRTETYIVSSQSTPAIEEFLRKHGLACYFKEMLTREMFPDKKAQIEYILDKSRVSPDEVLLVDD